MMFIKIGKSILPTGEYLLLILYCLVLFIIGIVISIMSPFWSDQRHDKVLKWFLENKPVLLRVEDGMVGVKDVNVCHSCSNKICNKSKIESLEPQKQQQLSPA